MGTSVKVQEEISGLIGEGNQLQRVGECEQNIKGVFVDLSLVCLPTLFIMFLCRCLGISWMM